MVWDFAFPIFHFTKYTGKFSKVGIIIPNTQK